jgi:hypothetical protein
MSGFKVKPEKVRGISYIFSVMLMTLIISSLAASVLLWGMGVVSQSQGAYGLVFERKIERVKERLVVEDVRFELTAPQKIHVYVRNIGGVPLTIDHIYVNHTLVSLENSVTLGIGKGGYVTVDSPLALEQGETYLITVATTRGKTVSGYWTAS